MHCPLGYLGIREEEMLALGTSGPAADTGKAVHHAANIFHNEKDAAIALGVMHGARNAYPFADLEQAAAMFRPYAADSRNIEARIIHGEAKIKTRLPAHETDPTGEEIVISGIIDQIREEPNGVRILWDIKTGKPTGYEMMIAHAFQLAAYLIGAERELGIRCHAVGIIRIRDYLSRKPGRVFWRMPWGIDTAYTLLDGVRKRVAEVRRGELYANPGDFCQYCALGGVPNCTNRIGEFSRGEIKLTRNRDCNAAANEPTGQLPSAGSECATGAGDNASLYLKSLRPVC